MSQSNRARFGSSYKWLFGCSVFLAAAGSVMFLTNDYRDPESTHNVSNSIPLIWSHLGVFGVFFAAALQRLAERIEQLEQELANARSTQQRAQVDA